VVVHCAAIAAAPEIELFGHADRDRPGLFLQADEGTLFLDEIGELSLDSQAKLLRVIEGQGFRPVGGGAEVHPDVRVVAASNRDLEALGLKGLFRPELLFRLRGLEIRVPPLREHAEDIPILSRFYLDRLSRELRRPLDLTPAALRRLEQFAWPGNVRQLWAVLESAAVLSDKSEIDAADLRLQTYSGTPTLNLEDLESWAIREALRQTRGNITRAAQLLGVVRDTLARKLKIKKIDRDG
jgi:Nif-specific regulatory protein